MNGKRLLIITTLTIMTVATSMAQTRRIEYIDTRVSTKSMAQTMHIDYVDTRVGTKSMGHTFPGACVPFGLVQLSPDTEQVPHNINGVYQPKGTNTARATSTTTPLLSASATPTSMARGTQTLGIS